LSTCRSASCGDGFVHAGVEECDDGNGDPTDACLLTCEEARCGDGFVHDGVEECDDGNDVSGDGCSAACVEEEVSTPDGGIAGPDGGVVMPPADAGSNADAGTMGPDVSGGCGCRAAGGSRSPWALALLGALALLAVRRRSR